MLVSAAGLAQNVTSPGNNPEVALSEAGEGVIVFEAGDADGTGIFAQRVASDGTALGDRFQVNTTTANDQRAPAATYLGNAGFVVAWESLEGTEPQVFAQRFAAGGTALGQSFAVSSTPASRFPAIDAAAAGDFVVAWSGTKKPNKTNKYRTYLQRFDAGGTALGQVLRVGANGEAHPPAVAVQPDGGDLLVVWRNKKGIIRGQLVAADGTALGDRFRIGSGAGGQSAPSVEVGADLDYTVTWEQMDGNGDSDADSDSDADDGMRSVYVRRVSRGGVALGQAMRISTTSSMGDAAPRISSDSLGYTVITWHRRGSSSEQADVIARAIDLYGLPTGVEMQVNPSDGYTHLVPRLAPDGQGGFLVTWERTNGDDDEAVVVSDSIGVP